MKARGPNVNLKRQTYDWIAMMIARTHTEEKAALGAARLYIPWLVDNGPHFDGQRFLNTVERWWHQLWALEEPRLVCHCAKTGCGPSCEFCNSIGKAPNEQVESMA